MDNDFYEFENRAYVQPTVSRDEQLAFADTLREIQAQNNAQIATQTENLGTDVPSNLGGLGGSANYFEQRYQATPLESQVNTLRATAQAKALSDLMTNYQNQMKNRYNQAYRNARAKAASSGSGGNSDGLPANVSVASPEDSVYSGAGAMTLSVDEGENATGISDPEGKYVKAYDPSGNIVATDDPSYAQADDGYYYNISGISVPFSMEVRFPTVEMRTRWMANQAAKNKYSQGGW